MIAEFDGNQYELTDIAHDVKIPRQQRLDILDLTVDLIRDSGLRLILITTRLPRQVD